MPRLSAHHPRRARFAGGVRSRPRFDVGCVCSREDLVFDVGELAQCPIDQFCAAFVFGRRECGVFDRHGISLGPNLTIGCSRAAKGSCCAVMPARYVGLILKPAQERAACRDFLAGLPVMQWIDVTDKALA